MHQMFATRLSLEEVVFLSHALRIRELPGFPLDPLAPLDADHQALALAVADRSLRARGLVQWRSVEDRRLDPALSGLFEHYSQPGQTLTVTMRLAASPLPLRYDVVFDTRFGIDHVQAEPGVHQFFVVNNAPDAWERLRDILGLSEAVGRGMPGLLSATTWQEAQQAALTDVEEAKALLGSELISATASGLAAALAQPVTLATLAHENADGQRLVVAQGHSGTYVVVAHEGSFQVLPVSLAQAYSQIEQFVRSDLDLLPAEPPTTPAT